jgi:DNA-binding NarL/FixJ family response regulator
MQSKIINLAIVDDHTLFRKTLKNYLSEQSNINVVIQSPDISDLLTKLKDFYVHVLLMDIFMPKINGNEAVKIIKEEYPDIKILVLSMCTNFDLLSDLLDAGVYGIISKAEEPEELLHAIRSLAEHRIYRSKLFTEVMYWNKQNDIRTKNDAGHIILSDREKEILFLLWEEKSNKEIADHLYLSIRSVEKIRQGMKEKVGVKSTVGLIKYAINKKIIKTDSSLIGNLYNTERRQTG